MTGSTSTADPFDEPVRSRRGRYTKTSATKRTALRHEDETHEVRNGPEGLNNVTVGGDVAESPSYAVGRLRNRDMKLFLLRGSGCGELLLGEDAFV